MRFGFKTFNDRLAVMLLLIIPLLWALDARGVLQLRSEVVGGTMITWALIANYYFRKAPPTPPTP